MASMPERHRKAQARKVAEGTNSLAAVKAAATRKARRPPAAPARRVGGPLTLHQAVAIDRAAAHAPAGACRRQRHAAELVPLPPQGGSCATCHPHEGTPNSEVIEVRT